MANNSICTEDIVDLVDGYDVVYDDLSSWEFVCPSESDDYEEVYSSNDAESGISAVDSEPEAVARGSHPPSHDDVISTESPSVSPPDELPVNADFTDQQVWRYHDDDSECEYDDENEGPGLDDELMPVKLKGRFGKERIRKIGKRVGSKVNKSKKVSYYYNRPGCVYGKHGLGVQHCLVW